MEVSVSAAKSRLTDLVRRAEAGDEVILTRHGQAAVRLVPIRRVPNATARGAIIEEVQRSAARKIASGEASAYPCAARSQDFLYDDDGLPG